MKPPVLTVDDARDPAAEHTSPLPSTINLFNG